MTSPVPPIGTQVSALAARDPEAPAATCDGVTVTRAGLDAATNRLARGFASLGVGLGDYVTIVLPNSLHWVYSVLACWKLGAVPQPLSARLPDAELAALLELRRPALLVGRPDPKGVTPSATAELAAEFARSAEISGSPLPEAVSPVWKSIASGGSTGHPKLIDAGGDGRVPPAIGYPLGAVVGGIVAAQLLQGNDWRSVFYFGAAVTAVLIPITYFVVPESVHWLARKQPAGALEKINKAMVRMGHPTTDALPTVAADVRQRSASDIFGPGLIGITAIVTLAYFFHITTFYFILKWVPKIVADFGFAASSAAGVLVWTNVGGAIGGAVLGLLTLRFGVKGLTIVVMVLSTVMVALFGRTPPNLQQLSMICAAAGFCTNAAIVGMYAIIAQVFPTHVRASGTGFAVGVGRGGSVLAPIIAGFLFTYGYSLPSVALTMSFGSLVAAGILSFLKLETDQTVTARPERSVRTTAIPATGRS